jgi:hypothetical protein
MDKLKIITIDDIEILISNSENISIKPENRVKYTKNVANKNELIKALNDTKYMSPKEYIEKYEENKNFPVVFDFLKLITDLIGDNISIFDDIDIFKDSRDPEKIREFIDTKISEGKIDDLLQTINNLELIMNDLEGIYNVSNLKDKLPYKDMIDYADIIDSREIYKNVIELLFDITEFISFDQLNDKINSMVSVFILKTKEQNNYDNIYFYVSDNIRKSNTWIFCLFWIKLQENIDYKLFKIKYSKKLLFVNNFTENILQDRNNIMVLHFDDMSYSGTQMSSDIKQNIRLLVGKNVDYFLAIPYYTTAALSKIYNIIDETEEEKIVEVHTHYIEELEKHKIYILENAKGDSHYKSVSEKINDNIVFNGFDNNMKNKVKFMLGIAESTKHMAIVVQNLFNTSIQYSLLSIQYTKPAVFFEHKLADCYSTYTALLYGGQIIGYYTKDYKNKCLSYPLIEPCSFHIFHEKKIKENNEKYCKPIYICESRDDNYGCPVTYYKRDIVKYIYKDKELYKTDFLFDAMIKHKNTVQSEGGGYLNKTIKIRNTKTKYNRNTKRKKYTRTKRRRRTKKCNKKYNKIQLQ